MLFLSVFYFMVHFFSSLFILSYTTIYQAVLFHSRSLKKLKTGHRENYVIYLGTISITNKFKKKNGYKPISKDKRGLVNFRYGAYNPCHEQVSNY